MDESGATEQAALPPSKSSTGESPTIEGPPLETLPGMTGEQIIKLLGKPQFLRDETSAALWQYRAGGCVLNLFLYRTGEALRVRHAEVRSRPAPGEALESRIESGPSASACLSKLAAAQAGATS